MEGKDLACFLKRHMLGVHRIDVGKTYKQKSQEQKSNDFKENRRETRTTILLEKRNIGNLSPFCTPEPTGLVRKTIQEKKPASPASHRLELLKKWKEEKEKKKAELKKRAKPIFKVCHLDKSIGLPNLENINKEIKGRPMRSKPQPSSFAPVHHTFRPPQNIKPINFLSGGKKGLTEENVTRLKSTSSSTSRSPSKASKRLVATSKTRKLTRQNAIDGEAEKVSTLQKKVDENAKSKKQPKKSQKVSKPTLKLQVASDVAPKTPDIVSNRISESTDNELVTRTERTPDKDRKVDPALQKDDEVFYSDDEISVKTPRHVLSAKNSRRKGTPFPRAIVISSTSSLEDTPKRSARVSVRAKKSSSRVSTSQSTSDVPKEDKTARSSRKISSDDVGCLNDEISRIHGEFYLYLILNIFIYHIVLLYLKKHSEN